MADIHAEIDKILAKYGMDSALPLLVEIRLITLEQDLKRLLHLQL